MAAPIGGGRRSRLLLAAACNLLIWLPRSGLAADTCAVAAAREPLGAGPTASAGLLMAAMVPPDPDDYRDRLATTALGWPRLDRWCVWVEPGSGQPGAAPWEQRWQRAVQAALSRWQRLLPLEVVTDPAAAHIQVHRRRPPLRREADGRLRASHGRAILQLQRVQRQGSWRNEPAVELLLSPGQRAEAMEATALHELGHAFGLWGHSDDPKDAMAAIPGAQPVGELSPRDLRTVRWLYSQPGGFGRP